MVCNQFQQQHPRNERGDAGNLGTTVSLRSLSCNVVSAYAHPFEKAVCRVSSLWTGTATLRSQ
jgi:hypothetical protein